MKPEKVLNIQEEFEIEPKKEVISEIRYEVPNHDDIPQDFVDYQFTFRSLIVGTILGGVVAASNIYLTLKIGWSFLGAFFGSIVGFAIISLMSPLPEKLGGGPLGIRETCTIQTCATATAGLTGVFGSVIPAMFRLGLMPALHDAWGLLFCWLIPASFFGIFFAVPLRTTFILKQKLPFPGPSSVSHVIKNLHYKNQQTSDNEGTSAQLKALAISLISSLLFRVITYFVPFLWGLHIFDWIGTAANFESLTNVDTLWHWYIQLTPAFLGGGLMVSLNVAYSLLFGSILAWGFIGPSIYHLTNIVDRSSGTNIQQWNLWVGVITMIVASIAELLFNYKTVLSALDAPYRFIKTKIFKRNGDHNNEKEQYDDDPAPVNERVPAWMWMAGTLVSLILTILVNHFYFKIYTGMTILCAILSFILSYVATLVAAQTNINPASIVAKISQAVFSVLPSPASTQLITNNLMCGGYTAHCVIQSSEMVGDLKTGHDLGASPRYQFYAQLIATIPGIFIAVSLFQLFASGYPCIIDPKFDATQCPFATPSVVTWQAVAVAFTTDLELLIPPSCRIAIGIFSALAIITVALRFTILKKYADYIPNFSLIGLAFTLPQPSISIALAIGATFSYFWKKRNPIHHSKLMMSVASGMVSGEGIGGLIMAILNIADVTQAKYATGFACPGKKPVGC